MKQTLRLVLAALLAVTAMQCLWVCTARVVSPPVEPRAPVASTAAVGRPELDRRPLRPTLRSPSDSILEAERAELRREQKKMDAFALVSLATVTNDIMTLSHMAEDEDPLIRRFARGALRSVVTR